MNKATIKCMTSLFIVMILTVGFAANSFAQYTFLGDEVIIDGDFSGDTLSSEWVVEGDTANFDAGVIDGELAFTNMAETANQYDFQANQPFSADQIAELAKGGTFELTFDARTTADSKTFHVFLGEVGGGWARYWQSPGDGDVTVTNSMETYTLTTDITETWDAMRLGFEVSTDTSSLFIDNVSLRKTSENVLEDGILVVGDSISSRWITEGGGANATFTAENGAVKISDIAADIASYAVQIRQELDSVQVDSMYAGPYEISFDAKTDAESKQIQVFVGNNGTDGGWTNFAPTVELTNEMTNYALTIDVTQNWENMKVGFEVAQDVSSVWLDNVILKRVREIAPDAPTFTLTTTDGVVTVSVSEVAGAATYDVYFSQSDFTETDSATYVGTIDPANGLTFEHSTAAPHPSVAFDFMAHYGVVAKSEKGTASDVTTNSIETGMTAAENYAVELNSDAVNAITSAIGNGEFPEASTLASFFPDNYVPFTIDGDNGVPVVGADVPSEDLTSKHWIGFETENDYLIIYAEVVDDSVVYATEADGSGGAWNFDSWEMGIGNYTPESFIEGSSHTTGMGGEEPDWQLRGGGLVGDGSVRGFIHGYGFNDTRINGEVPNSQTLIEATDTGYRALTLITTVNLVGDTQDKAFNFPTGSEVALYPFQIAMNDNDAAARDLQKAWGSNAVSGDWWQNPWQWNVVAFVGLDAVSTSNEEPGSDQPMKVSLDQNYPNPFNPSTNINFTLPSASKVTLDVFNVLGQKVATLINNESLTAGAHSHAFDASNLSSGLYIYRLKVGSSFISSKKMMLIK